MLHNGVKMGLVGLSVLCTTGGGRFAFGQPTPLAHAAKSLQAASLQQAPDAATLKAQREIEKEIHVRDAAFSHKDAEAALRYYSEDYHYQSDTGPETKADLRKSTVGLFGIAKTIHSTATIEGLHLTDGGKTATLLEKTHVLLMTSASKTEKSHTMQLYSTVRSVWVKSSDGTTWLKQSQTSISRTGSIDGVPQTMPTPAPAAPAAPVAPVTPAVPAAAPPSAPA